MTQAKLTSIRIDDIDFKLSPKVRAHIDRTTVKEYSVLYSQPDCPLPPPDVFKLNTHPYSYVIGDGRHRLEAAKLLNMVKLECKLHEGGRAECVKFALGSNAAHGLPRTKEDRVLIVEFALKEFTGVSDREIGRICIVDHELVGKVRSRLEAEKKITHTEQRIAGSGAIRPSHNATARGSGKLTGGIPPVSSGESDPTKEVELLDKVDYPIPEELHDLWNRRHEFTEMVQHLRAVADTADRAAKDKDPLFWELNHKDLISGVHSLVEFIKKALPYAVCLNCQGRKASNCAVCGNNKFISLMRFRSLPEELRKFRTKK